MKHYSYIFPAFAAVLIFLFGCSGRSDMITPDPEGGLKIESYSSGHALWGLWNVAIDPDTGDAEIIPVRSAEFHVNVTGKLQPPSPMGLSIQVIDFNPAEGAIDLNLTITHPFPNSNLRGFDVRGIAMGSGDMLTSEIDGVTFPAPDGFRLVNADGYTRWWNAVEFTTPGLFGFKPGALGPQDFSPPMTLNGYKYFADPLGPVDHVVPAVSLENRGTFSTDTDPPELTRKYIIQFPEGPGGNHVFLFQYAIDASWALPTGGSPSPKPIDDFPIQANCPEVFHMGVDTDGTTAYYESDMDFGGDVLLEIEVFDWEASEDPDGIDGQVVTLMLESPTLFDGIINIPLDSEPGSQPTSGIYSVMIPDVTPTSTANQEILINAKSCCPSTYEPPTGNADYPFGLSLAGYQLVEIPVLDTALPQGEITVTVPNGGELWEQGTSAEITWNSTGNVGSKVKIGYTISDGNENLVVTSTDNDGSYNWPSIPNIDSDEVRIVITSVEDTNITDESDQYLSVHPPQPGILTIVSPNGGEEWVAGYSGNITWESEGNAGYEVKLQYKIGTATPVNIVGVTDNDGDHLWAPIPDIESDQVKIIISSVSMPSINDESDDYFTITSDPDPMIIVTQPNGGESWHSGSSQEITWDNIGDTGYTVRIDYYYDDGDPINIVSSTNNDGSFIWNPIPDIESDQVKIVIYSFVFPSINDESDGFFSIY